MVSVYWFLLLDLGCYWEFGGRAINGGFFIIPYELSSFSLARPSYVTTYGAPVVIAETYSVITLWDSTFAEMILLLDVEPAFLRPIYVYFFLISSIFSFFSFACSSSSSLVKTVILFFSYIAFNFERLDDLCPFTMF